MLGDSVRFLGQFLLKPGTIGAIAPSSASLAKEMVKGLNLATARAVLEYGPGTGVFTEQILEKMDPNSRFIAIEINPDLAKVFRTRYPNVVLVQDSVGNVRKICADAGIEAVDCIVSGLPWAAFGDAMQAEFLNEMKRVLKPGGMFVTFAYVHGAWLPAGKRFLHLLPNYFGQISRSRVVWKNLPPAFIYRCRR